MQPRIKTLIVIAWGSLSAEKYYKLLILQNQIKCLLLKTSLSFHLIQMKLIPPFSVCLGEFCIFLYYTISFIHSFIHYLFIHVHMYDCIPQAYHILLEFDI